MKESVLPASNTLSRMAFFQILAVSLLLAHEVQAEHHMKIPVAKRQSGGGTVPMLVANWCQEDIWPGVITQGGSGADMTGFKLSSGSNQTIHVSSDWQGRIWGRTNCSFDGSGHPSGGNSRACSTGDCGSLSCEVAGASPATLAEFTLDGGQDQTFYDISLVDGYNLPMAIVMVPNGQSNVHSNFGSETNPVCVASVGNLAAQNFNPYANGQQFLGTNSQNPLPFENKVTSQGVSNWCPWDLQVDAPLAPGDGVYPYPDGNVQRPPFAPCLSACAKYGSDNYCCLGSYNGPSKCSPNYYAKAAKNVCPDAYSFAYDDQDSTFIIPKGPGFQVVFCPGGRSTQILATMSVSPFLVLISNACLLINLSAGAAAHPQAPPQPANSSSSP